MFRWRHLRNRLLGQNLRLAILLSVLLHSANALFEVPHLTFPFNGNLTRGGAQCGNEVFFDGLPQVSIAQEISSAIVSPGFLRVGGQRCAPGRFSSILRFSKAVSDTNSAFASIADRVQRAAGARNVVHGRGIGVDNAFSLNMAGKALFNHRVRSKVNARLPVHCGQHEVYKILLARPSHDVSFSVEHAEQMKVNKDKLLVVTSTGKGMCYYMGTSEAPIGSFSRKTTGGPSWRSKIWVVALIAVFGALLIVAIVGAIIVYCVRDTDSGGDETECKIQGEHSTGAPWTIQA